MSKNQIHKYQQMMLDVFQVMSEWILRHPNAESVSVMCCGTGPEASFLARLMPESEVQCFDISEENISILQHRLCARGLDKVFLHVADLDEKLPDNVGQFDLIVIVFGLHLLSQPIVSTRNWWQHSNDDSHLITVDWSNKAGHETFVDSSWELQDEQTVSLIDSVLAKPEVIARLYSKG